MVRLGQPVLNAVLAADLIEAKNPVARRPAIPVTGQVGKLDAVICEHRVKPVGNGFNQGFQEGHGRRPIGLLL